MCSLPQLRVPHPRVEERVGDIDDQVRDRDEQRAENGHTHHRGEVVAGDALDRILTNPWEVKHVLGDEGATQQERPRSRPNIVTTGVSAARRPCL